MAAAILAANPHNSQSWAFAASDHVIGVFSFGWFRASQDDIRRHRDGLTLNGQGLSPMMLTLAKLMPASSRTAGDQFWVKQTAPRPRPPTASLRPPAPAASTTPRSGSRRAASYNAST